MVVTVFGLPHIQGQESDSSETSVRGPRIKHVCRRAAVALGRKRAVFPDDMPTLSALPWEEREKILSSMGNDGRSGRSTWSQNRLLICLLIILGMPSRLFIVSLGPLKNRWQEGIKNMRILLKEMPEKGNGEVAREGWESCQTVMPVSPP